MPAAERKRRTGEPDGGERRCVQGGLTCGGIFQAFGRDYRSALLVEGVVREDPDPPSGQERPSEGTRFPAPLMLSRLTVASVGHGC